jgi:hypothetical protein
MAINFNTPKYPFNMPFFMFDIDNKQLITTTIIPGDISDNKDIVLVETPVPGLNANLINYAGGGVRKVSFTLPLVKRNNTVGNILILKQFDNLRNQAAGLTSLFTSQFTPTPKVLFYYGTGSIPLIWWVKKCDATHKQGWVNALGHPQYSEINIELWLDETNVLYKAEEVFRKLASLTGMVVNAYDTIDSQVRGSKPY